MPTAKNVHKRSHIFLPQIDDLLRMIDQWCARTGVSRADLANLLDLDRSEATRVFKGGRRLVYSEAQTWVDFLLERLSPLPEEPVQTIATPSRDLRYVQSSETVGGVAKRLTRGNFTQIPVFDGLKYLGLATDRMIVERLLHPNVKRFEGAWADCLRKMPVGEAGVIETSAIYPSNASISEVANALTQYYAVMISDNSVPEGIVTRWDYLKLLSHR
jgi:predicted transcriptional regulator